VARRAVGGAAREATAPLLINVRGEMLGAAWSSPHFHRMITAHGIKATGMHNAIPPVKNGAPMPVSRHRKITPIS